MLRLNYSQRETHVLFNLSFVNPGMSLCLEELSCGGKSRESLMTSNRNVDRDLYQMVPATAIKEEIVDPGRRAIKNLVVLSCAFM